MSFRTFKTRIWPRAPLRQVAKQIDRWETPASGVTYKLIGVKWWGGGVHVHDTVDGSKTKAAQLRRVRADDLVINKIWARHGSVAVVPAIFDGYHGSGEFPTFQIDRMQVSPRWLHWLAQSRSFWAACEELSRGTSGKNRIKPDRFLSIEIPLPSLPEQQRIVAWLDSLSSRILGAKELCSELNADAAAFVASLHLQLAGPRRMKLSDVFDLDEIEEPVISTTSYPQVGIRGFGGGLFQKDAVPGTGTTYRFFHRLYPDAIVLSQVKGWEGAIAVAGPELDGWFTSPEYRTFRCKPEAAHPDYMRALLPSPWFIQRLQGLSRGQGARRQRTRPEQFLALELPMPTRTQQETALKAFSRMSRARESLPEETDLAALLPSALAQVFGG
jgi:type I restriction enzyme S subunit